MVPATHFEFFSPAEQILAKSVYLVTRNIFNFLLLLSQLSRYQLPLLLSDFIKERKKKTMQVILAKNVVDTTSTLINTISLVFFHNTLKLSRIAKIISLKYICIRSPGYDGLL